MRAKGLLAILITLALAGASMADLQSEAVAQVWVDIVSNIAVAPITALVDLGDYQPGVIPGVLLFRVDANLETVDLQVCITQLYKGDSALAESIIPVGGLGAQVTPENGSEVRGGTGLLEWVEPFAFDGLVGFCSQIGTFESGQNGHFSQAVTVEVEWETNDPELTTGEYSGFVVLRGLVLPITAG